MKPFDEPFDNPMQAFREWLADAEKSEPNDPSAAALATATLTGLPSVRMVLTKGAEDRGIRLDVWNSGRTARIDDTIAFASHVMKHPGR